MASFEHADATFCSRSPLLASTDGSLPCSARTHLPVSRLHGRLHPAHAPWLAGSLVARGATWFPNLSAALREPISGCGLSRASPQWSLRCENAWLVDDVPCHGQQL